MGDPSEFLSISERIEHVIAGLPTVSKPDIPLDDACPICLNPFESIYEGRTLEEDDTVELPYLGKQVKLRGVTRLDGCGHVFCRLDLIEWIRGRHGTCPTCRYQFANIRPPSDSDNESSDGDYVPDEEDEEEDDGFLDTDGFDEEIEFEIDEMDFEVDEFGVDADFDVDVEAFDREDEYDREDTDLDNLGLSDGDTMSDGDLMVSGDEGLAPVDVVEVFDGEADYSGLHAGPANQAK